MLLRPVERSEPSVKRNQIDVSLEQLWVNLQGFLVPGHGIFHVSPVGILDAKFQVIIRVGV